MRETDAQLAELRGQVEGLRRRTRVMLGIVGLAVIVAIAPMVVLAATFADVPNTNLFYNDIERVAGAGIAAGCGGSNYCPKNTVTREQMAAFLARTGGRAGFDWFAGTNVPDTYGNLASIQLRAGNVAGGTAHVLITATWSIYPSVNSGFPYGAQMRLLLNGQYLTDTTVAIGSINDNGNAALQWVVTVPTGVTQTIALQGYQTLSANQVTATGSLAAVYVPFAADGSNAQFPDG